MKKNYFFRLCAAIAAIALQGQVFAQSQDVTTIPAPKGYNSVNQIALTSEANVRTLDNGVKIAKSSANKSVKASDTRAEAETFAVKCHFKYEVGAYFPESVRAYNESSYDRADYDFVSDEIELSLPAGTYDFLANYWRMSEESHYNEMGFAQIVKEQVVVDGPLELEFDAAEATNAIRLAPRNHLGELVKVETWKYTNAYNGMEKVDDGNSWNMIIDSNLLYKGNLVLNFDRNTSINLEASEYSGIWKGEEWYSTWYINDVSDNYAFFNRYFIEPNSPEIPYLDICEVGTTGIANTLVSNRAASYYKNPIRYDIEHTPNAVDIPENPYGIIFQVVRNEEDEELSDRYDFLMRGENKDQIYTTYYCPDKSYELETHIELKYMLFENTFTGITSPSIVPIDDNDYYSKDVYGFVNLNVSDGDYVNVFVEPMSFSLQECDMLPGASMPFGVVQFYPQGDFTAEDFSLIGFPAWTGQMGEMRFLDDEYTTSETKQLGDRHMLFNYADENTAVDGLPGKCTIMLDFDYSQSLVAPTLTAVQCRTSEGRVADRFENAADGVLTFMAAGFNQFSTDGGLNNPGYEPVAANVYYSEHDKNAWRPLEVVCDPDILLLPGVGNYFTCSLADVDEASESKWYDIRISLETENGNYAEHEFSPMFRIENVASIVEELTSAACASEAEYFNLQGMRIANPGKGLYIRRCGDKVEKVMLKD